MGMSFRRRDFLRIIAVSTASAGLASCTTDDELSSDPADQLRVFPQGVASGDPSPESVILWTRAQPEAGGAIPVTYEVATDEGFTSIVAQGAMPVDDSTDHTLRLKITGLSAYTTYYYRFVAENVISVTGRTKTAPAPDEDVNVRFAFASCQDFNGRYFHAWRALVEEEDDVDFVLFLGDYVYETEGDPRFQDPAESRKVVIEDGIAIGEEDAQFKAALTLADYRSLYKTYRSDADLREAHRLFPFIAIWDDHEFADDCWQDNSTHFNEAKGSEADPARRHAASQAWFEYQPADLDFDAGASFPEDIQIYRTLRYGKHVDIILSDQRYYRDDHLIAEGPQDPDVGKIFDNSSLFSRQLVIKPAFDAKEAAAQPSMLGTVQKEWLKTAITSSDATWKFWGNETQLAQMVVDLRTGFDMLPDSYKQLFYFTVDQWDGYRSERAEILAAIAATPNVVALTGDIHAFYACEIYEDFDAPSAVPVCVEYTTAGISSRSVQEITERIIEQDPLLSSLGLLDAAARFDEVLAAASPHYLFHNSRSYGLSIVDVEGDSEIRVTFVEVANSTEADYSGVKARHTFRTPSGTPSVEIT